MTEAAEHPDGLLIDDAARQWLPDVYAAWREAWSRWSALGVGGSYTMNWKGELVWPERYHPLLVAAVDAEAKLKAACLREFAKPEWLVTAMVEARRIPIDGDFLRDANLNFKDRSARGGPIGNKTIVTVLRVRRVVDIAKERTIVACQPETPPWMDERRPWKDRVPALCDAARTGTLPAETAAAPEALIEGNLKPHGAKAKCLRWICEVTRTPLDKDGKAPSSIEKHFRDYLKTAGLIGN